MTTIPVIDVAHLLAEPDGGPRAAKVATAIDRACRDVGFFLITGYDAVLPPALLSELESLARAFFAQGAREKEEIAMARAGPAWRGWFPLGGELTSGKRDGKEGIYFGTEEAERGGGLRLCLCLCLYTAGTSTRWE